MTHDVFEWQTLPVIEFSGWTIGAPLANTDPRAELTRMVAWSRTRSERAEGTLETPSSTADLSGIERPDVVIDEYLIELLWMFGRCLMLTWLKDTERIESWFVHAGIDSAPHIARSIVRVCSHPSTTMETQDWLAHVLHDVEEVADDLPVSERATYEIGIKCLERATLQLPLFSARHARALHLITFVHRVAGNRDEYEIALRRMKNLVLVEREPSGCPAGDGSYDARLTYEIASELRYGLGARGEGGRRQRLDDAAHVFEDAASLALRSRTGAKGSRQPLEHVMYGATRGALLCLMDLHDYERARYMFSRLLTRFKGAEVTHLAFDTELIRAMESVRSEGRHAVVLSGMFERGLGRFLRHGVGHIDRKGEIVAWLRCAKGHGSLFSAFDAPARRRVKVVEPGRVIHAPPLAPEAVAAG